MRSFLVTDTSVVYAALNPRERHHQRSAELMVSGVSVVLPAPVITETTMLAHLRRNTKAVEVVLRSILDETLAVVNLERLDYARALDLVMRYADLPLSFVDAAVVAIAERLEEDTIATLDRRHFSVVRPAHVEAFNLVP
jgi:uncharacterized protein